ncbi:FimV/HubP family polar landmark protein [Stenotrophomonas sp. Iso1]|uniref:FimV/HubP family polar landmark protein n=1 Tax=Stenotrophomonas sp. Iso1 TaxID=2977283 RepID=UPI0022B7B0A8|nr:FimV/HubP family polar landmark protein [Stenotrophomonas sp. Iso1]
MVLILALFSSAAMALGLGNIRVLSKPGQPLVAEIPVITSDSSELDNARATLAAPATFERVGLPPPDGLVSELQFQFAQDREGRAVIRVTSATPVQVPSVGFLIEVDWGQGRLVREYSALVAAPETATAVAEPVIEAPAAAPSDLIVREPEPLPQAPAALPQPVAVPTPAPLTPSAPVQAARPPMAPVSRPAGELAPVQRGQSLSQIAGALTRENGYSLNQNMVALMRANPEAFIRGNVNLLKQGAVLRTPAEEELARVNAAEARTIVREQTAQWRQARAPIPQPAIADAAVVARPATNNHAAAAPSGARLEIAPAVAGGQQTAGMTTGLDAGGEGDMLANEQLQQAREDLATRDVEMQELRDRVAELEKLQKQQQSLIAMKDSDLAAAQQRLAESNKQDAAASLGWLWLGLALLVLAVVAWALSRRRKPSPLKTASREGFNADTLAAALPAGAVAFDHGNDGARDADLEASAAFATDARKDEGEDVVTLPPHDADMPLWAKPEAAVAGEPLPPVESKPALMFEASRGYARPQELPSVSEPAAADEARWLAGDMAAVAPLNPAPAGRERLELAIAYLDLGDAETARTLLNEVALGSDPLARTEALELLNRLG